MRVSGSQLSAQPSLTLGVLNGSVRMLKMAPLCGFRRPALRLLRRWPVRGFENWLMFCQAIRDGLKSCMSSTVRVISRTS